jgi:predicted O-methyltransferase YrrM
VSDIVQYINSLQPHFDGVLGEIQQAALDEGLPIIPPETAHFLATLLSLKRPRRVLEVGCAVGFSAGLFARYLTSDGHITTIDRYDYMIDKARQNFKRLGIEACVSLIEGNATEILPQLSGTFDVIFLDAAKGQYIRFLPDCLRLLNDGGLLLADDILQAGRVALGRFAVPRRQRTIQARLNAFLREVFACPALESSIIPIGDGLLLAHKIEKDRKEEPHA